MNNRTIDKNTHDVLNDCAVAALKKGYLLEAIDNIGAILHYCTDDTLKYKLDTLQDAYRSMLGYAIQGITDVDQNQHITTQATKLYSILLCANRDIRLQRNETHYAKAYNQLQEIYGADITGSLLNRWKENLTPDERSETQDLLFNCLWTQPIWSDKDIAQWYDFINCQNELVQPHLAGAIFLSAYEYPDAKKLELLYLLSNTENKRLLAVTSAGIWMMLLTQKKNHGNSNHLIALPKQTIGRDALLNVEIERQLMMLSIKDQEIEDRTVAKITEHLDAEGLQQLLKVKVRHTKNRMKRGLDVNLAKVSLLHGCAYLKECSHWWLPFDKTLTQFQNVMTNKDGKVKKKLSRLTDLIYDCDVDMLALLYTISISDHAEEMLAPFDEIEIPDESELGEKHDFTVKKTIQNMYRFFHHSQIANELESPFDNRFDPYDVFHEGQQLSTEQNLRLCSLLRDNEAHETVCEVLTDIIEHEGANAEMLTLLGECHFALHHHTQAYNYLKQAEVLGNEDVSVLHKLQMCCILMHRYEEANEYLKRIKKQNTGLTDIDSLIARNLVIMRKYDEALKKFFENDFVEPGDLDTIVGIIECCMQLNKLETAEKYCTQLMGMSLSGNEADILYCGHISMMRGDLQEALQRYLLYFDMMSQRYDQTTQKSMKEFENSLSDIPAGKVSHTDLTLMHEMIQFSR